MDWTNYHTLETIYAFMDNLQAEYPYLCSVEVIGKSVEGRDLKVFVTVLVIIFVLSNLLKLMNVMTKLIV